MKRILALALLTTIPAFGIAQTQSQKHPVDDFFMSGIAAFNAHNLESFMRQFAGDIEMYTPTGWLRGQQEVRQRFAQTFKQFPSVRMEIENLRVREIAPGTVVHRFQLARVSNGSRPRFPRSWFRSLSKARWKVGRGSGT